MPIILVIWEKEQLEHFLTDKLELLLYEFYSISYFL